MAKQPIQHRYVSDIDQCLQTFDKKNPSLSLTQKKERDKHRAVYAKRDQVDLPMQTKTEQDPFQ